MDGNTDVGETHTHTHTILWSPIKYNNSIYNLSFSKWCMHIIMTLLPEVKNDPEEGKKKRCRIICLTQCLQTRKKNLKYVLKTIKPK